MTWLNHEAMLGLEAMGSLPLKTLMTLRAGSGASPIDAAGFACKAELMAPADETS